jgi:hypothetical protein
VSPVNMIEDPHTPIHHNRMQTNRHMVRLFGGTNHIVHFRHTRSVHNYC